jgi:hypothetical protein
VSHFGLAIYIKMNLKAKEELWKLKYFTMQKYDLQKILLKETKILQDIITCALPPPPYLLPTGSNLSSCRVVVNAPRSVIQKKKDKKRSKYVALDFSEKTNPKNKNKKRSKYVALDFSAHFLFFIFYFVSSSLLI